MGKFTGYESEIKNGNILSVQMNILNICTSRCKSCRKYTWPNDKLSLDDICNTLKVLKEKFGLQTVVFSGGDPILYLQFDKVIEFCVNEDISFSLITTLITSNKNLVEMIAKYAYRIHCSIDSTNISRYKVIRGVDGLKAAFFNIKTINTIRKKENKIPIRISSTISKMNYDETYKLYEFAKCTGSLINFYFLHTWDDLKMSNEEIGEFYNQIEKVCINEKESKNIISNSRGVLLQKYDYDSESYSKHCKSCYIPRVSATINANGDIYPCCFLLQDNNSYGHQLKYAYGNICGKSLEDIEREFNKRLYIRYPLDDKYCQECGQRYSDELNDLEKIIEGRKDKIFL